MSGCSVRLHKCHALSIITGDGDGPLLLRQGRPGGPICTPSPTSHQNFLYVVQSTLWPPWQVIQLLSLFASNCSMSVKKLNANGKSRRWSSVPLHQPASQHSIRISRRLAPIAPAIFIARQKAENILMVHSKPGLRIV